MSEEEKEAFDKWMDSINHPIFGMENSMVLVLQSAFISGYRACRRVQAMEQLIEAGAEQMGQEEQK